MLQDRTLYICMHASQKHLMFFERVFLFISARNIPETDILHTQHYKNGCKSDGALHIGSTMVCKRNLGSMNFVLMFLTLHDKALRMALTR